MDDLDKYIRIKMHVKRNDNLPHTGWTRAINREGLAEIFNEAGFKKGCEVGVRRGGYSVVLCQKIPGLELFCVDPWIPYRGRRPSQEHQDHIYEDAVRNLAPYNCHIIRKTSMEAVKDFADNSLDFVYIDAMHEFDPVMMDIICWTPKVKIGGIVAGHDYVDSYTCGVIDAVRAYTFYHNIYHWYITYDWQKKEGTPSWFWVKQR